MQLQTSSDPLGEATTVTVDLPRQDLGHFRPWDELAALHAAGLESTSAVFIDAPTETFNIWPAADAAFLHAIADGDPETTVSPLVWARIRTAPRYPSLREVKAEKFPFHVEQRVPRESTWPPDFSGVPTAKLTSTLRGEPGSRLALHVPPGDGWHRVAWVRQDVEGLSMSSLLCECSLQHVVKAGGGTISFRVDADCAYRPVTAYLRALSLRHLFPEATPEALRAMVDAALTGMWLGQRHGDDLWGSNLYLQTVSAVLDVPMPWELAHTAVESGLISLDGAVLGLPQPIRTAPVGPVMDWDSTEATDGDWVVWWSRLDDRYQVEVTRDPDNTSQATLTVYDRANSNVEIHTEQIGLAYGAVFGPDTGDVNHWRAIASKAVDEHKS
ncbi:hypothetical protein H483_0106090 [Dietzia sp. UCD-THP]|uniref:hypothetical protein n=1 Tax=Dietzia sp. UCD-THP TaxID=1292020 RepID=UPI0003612551|nr:hypothetical protein [Dietzia sp. UCD-THP]EYT64023.1 hypothetical protein H483_0106090 [Dietzia sp. UCD-THP]